METSVNNQRWEGFLENSGSSELWSVSPSMAYLSSCIFGQQHSGPVHSKSHLLPACAWTTKSCRKTRSWGCPFLPLPLHNYSRQLSLFSRRSPYLSSFRWPCTWLHLETWDFLGCSTISCPDACKCRCSHSSHPLFSRFLPSPPATSEPHSVSHCAFLLLFLMDNLCIFTVSFLLAVKCGFPFLHFSYLLMMDLFVKSIGCAIVLTLDLLIHSSLLKSPWLMGWALPLVFQKLLCLIK